MTRARGEGSIFQPKYTDRHGQRRTARTWAIQYYDRRQHQHVTEFGFRTEAAAAAKLRRYLSEQDKGIPTGPALERITFKQLAEGIVNDYVNNGRDSLPRLKQSLAHLRRLFGRDRAPDITDERIEAYKAHRLRAGARPATINRELAALKRMFKLARKRVPVPPTITMLEERNVRKGFFEPDQYEAVLRHMPAELRPVLQVAYITGWRVPSEILTRQWRHVDFVGGWLRLEPGEAKNEDGRMFPLDPELRPILEALRDATRAFEQEAGRVVPWVFHLDGDPIGSFRKTWQEACVKAGLGSEVRDVKGRLVKRTADRLPHDFRRTAVRNLERSGVPRSAAMAMVGHKTESVYRRYAIVDEAMLKDAAQQLARGRAK